MNPVTGLSLGRIAIGAAALAKPELVGNLLGRQGGSDLMTQWFGSREVALGAATLLASGGGRRTLVLLGMGVDGADALTAFKAVQGEQLPRELGLGMVGVASGAVASGLLGLRGKKKAKRTQ